ncbi:MAG: M48 family metalloprotease [Alphaproteobacteria bacterium]
MKRLKNKGNTTLFWRHIITVLCCITAFMTAPDIDKGVLRTISAHGASGKGLSLIRDTEIETILKSWSAPIFKAAGLSPEAVNIILVKSDEVNAFVAGGANIFIYTGLIQKTDNPGELIGVIAHETGHIAGGHLIRSREAMERASYESIIGTLLGIGAAIASGDAGAASAGVMGGSTIAQRRYLTHSRIQESSADQAALTFLEKAKINPAGMESFMQKMKADMYVPESQQSEYTRTHPLMENRMQALEHRANQSLYKDRDYPALWQRQHARMKAKLTGFIHPRHVPWIYDDRDVSIPAQYARAIAAYRNIKIDEALNKVDALIRQEPKNPYFIELKAQILFEFGQIEKAAKLYRKASDLLPQAPLLKVALAHALIESTPDNDKDRLNEAIKKLESALRKEQRSSRIHRLLAIAYGRIGEENRAKLHLAEEALLQRRHAYARQHIEAILSSEPEGSSTWIKAKDIKSYMDTDDNK